ncbi:MAG: hypothetical protein QM749_17695 [Aquabacterium sp.]
MIAKNLLKYAQAFALQLPLRFGPLRMLRQARPTTRAGRIARAARKLIRTALIKRKVVYPVKHKPRPKPKQIASSMMQLSLFVNVHSLLTTKAGHTWVQVDLPI